MTRNIIIFLKISTRLASGVTCSVTDELNGIQPLKTAPPPKVLGYNRTLANVKAPAKHCHHLSAGCSYIHFSIKDTGSKRQTSLTEPTDKYIVEVCASSYFLVYCSMNILNGFKQTTLVIWRILKKYKQNALQHQLIRSTSSSWRG